MLVIGLNHKTAPIEIREKFYLNRAESDLLLSELKSNPAVSEVFVLSTCNRVEVYLKRADDSFDAEALVRLIAKVKKVAFNFDYAKHLYVYQDGAAIMHLMRVATGLDSLVLGEKQILGQVKDAVERARELGTIATYFNVLTNLAIRSGKKAQHETSIGLGGLSISWSAIEMAERILGPLAGRKVLVIGAGKMGELALATLQSKGLEKMYMMNRTGEKAEQLAEAYGGTAASFWDIKEILQEVDLCICSVGAPHYILDKEKISYITARRDGRPLVFIDISMPRNIDPQVGTLPGVFLRSIDDLDQVVQETMSRRQGAVNDVEAIIAQKIREFDVKIEKLKSSPASDYYEVAE